MASSMRKRMTWDFQKQIYKTCGIHTLILTAYRDEKRDVRVQKEKGVTFGFCQGNKMANEDGLLLSEGRKQIYVMYIKSLSEIREDVVRALLFEAAMVDEEFGRAKSRKRKK